MFSLPYCIYSTYNCLKSPYFVLILCVAACFLTLRKASFCSRCLLIRGRRWSLSADIPSLSWLPHQSSSRRYSCSRLSNTLHTWTGPESQRRRHNRHRLGESVCGRAPAQTSCRRPQRHWRASSGPPSSASAAASERPLSQHSFGSPLDRSVPPAEPSGSEEAVEGNTVRQRQRRVKGGHDEHPVVSPAWIYLSFLLDLQGTLMGLLQRVGMEERLREEGKVWKVILSKIANSLA